MAAESRAEERSSEDAKPENLAQSAAQSTPFRFHCSCLNVKVEGRAPPRAVVAIQGKLGDQSTSEAVWIWLGRGAETIVGGSSS